MAEMELFTFRLTSKNLELFDSTYKKLKSIVYTKHESIPSKALFLNKIIEKCLSMNKDEIDKLLQEAEEEFLKYRR